MVANIENWARTQPEVLEVSQRLNEAGIAWGYFSGTLAEVAGVRSTDDLDILVSSEDFLAAAQALDTQPEPRVITMCAADHRRLHFVTEEIATHVGQLDVQVMRSAPMIGQVATYELDMTPLAAQSRLSPNIDGVTVHFANPFDTLAAKATMWRGPEQGKHDASDIVALRKWCSVDASYAHARGREIGLTPLEWSRLGDLALRPQPLLASVAPNR